MWRRYASTNAAYARLLGREIVARAISGRHPTNPENRQRGTLQ
jgi:hypothetical protein